MNRTATYPSSLLAHCCKALGVSAFGAATTPPYKSLICNALRTLSLAREGAMRRVCWASHAENALLSLHKRYGCLSHTKSFKSHTESTELHRNALAPLVLTLRTERQTKKNCPALSCTLPHFPELFLFKGDSARLDEVEGVIKCKPPRKCTL